MVKDYLTHKEIETMCDLTLQAQGWVRQSSSGNSNNWKPYLASLPDRIYKREDKLLILEIKPGNARQGELKRALGQMLCYYLYDVKAYLVLSPEQWEKLKRYIELFPWMGVLTYARKMKEDLTFPLEIAQKAASKQGVSVVSYPVSLEPFIPLRERRTFIYEDKIRRLSRSIEL